MLSYNGTNDILSQRGGISMNSIKTGNVFSVARKYIQVCIICMLVLFMFDAGNASFAANAPEAENPGVQRSRGVWRWEQRERRISAC
jgi:hypothetical protein